MSEPRTEAGRAMEEWLREPDDYEWGRKITDAILAIEHEAAGSAGADPEPHATTRGNLAQALLATELIDRLMEYARKANPDTMRDEDRQQVAWSWANRIGDWLDEVNGSWRAQGGPSLDVERLARALDACSYSDMRYTNVERQAQRIAAEYARFAPADPVEET